MESFNMAWLITESTMDVRDAIRVTLRRNVIWKRSPVITMGCAERSALAS
jgi:hypothetical protein